MRNIRIEEVGDINVIYPYLEVFLDNETSPFLDIGINDDREITFKYYASQRDVTLGVEDWEHILNTAKDFLPKALANEDTFNKWMSEITRLC